MVGEINGVRTVHFSSRLDASFVVDGSRRIVGEVPHNREVSRGGALSPAQLTLLDRRFLKRINARLIVSQIVLETLEGLAMRFPQIDPDRARELHQAREQLLG